MTKASYLTTILDFATTFYNEEACMEYLMETVDPQDLSARTVSIRVAGG